jgi:hypothetical protein
LGISRERRRHLLLYGAFETIDSNPSWMWTSRPGLLRPRGYMLFQILSGRASSSYAAFCQLSL